MNFSVCSKALPYIQTVTTSKYRFPSWSNSQNRKIAQKEESLLIIDSSTNTSMIVSDFYIF